MSVTSASRRTPAHAIQVHHYLCVYVCVYEYVCALVSISCSSAVAFLINTGVFSAHTEQVIYDDTVCIILHHILGQM